MSGVSSDLSVVTKQDNVLLKIRDQMDVDATAIIKKAIMF